MVRRIETDELDALRAARLAMLADEPWRERFLREEERFDALSWRDRARAGAESHDFATFVAPVAEGWAGVIDVAVNKPETSEIGGMWVYPTYRRRGIGRALVDAALVWSRDRGVQEVTLVVVTTNSPALALYASVGFSIDGDPCDAAHVAVRLQRMTMPIG